MSDRLSTFRLSLENIKRKPYRTLCLILTVAVFSFSIFCGSILTQSLRNGITTLSFRIGADMMVVPKGSETDFEAALLRSEPGAFYMEEGFTQKIANTEGVAQCSPQLFIESLNASCCTVPVQLIGFDPVTDFTIKPWIKTGIGNEMGIGDAVIGDLILAEPGDTIWFYGQPFRVVEKLDKTGMGFDSSVFMTMDAAQNMIANSIQTAAHPAGGRGKISSVMIKLLQDADSQKIADEIAVKYPDTDVVTMNQMMSGVSSQLNRIAGMTSGILILLWLVAVFVLFVVFSVTVNERKREFAILLSLGSTHRKLSGIIILESTLVSLIGAVCGVLIGSLIIFPFNTLISSSLGLPYLNPSAMTVAGYIALSIGISVATGPLASIYSAVKTGKMETYLVFKENE